MKSKYSHSTYLVSIEQAAFDILYVLMLADGHADEREFEIIKKYLSTEFIRNSPLFNNRHSLYSECNFDKEYSYLKTLDKENLIKRFKKALAHLEEWLKEIQDSERIKKDLYDFSYKMITADGTITKEENELLEIMKNELNI